jgi:N-acylneuraminate cytidylyltransferase
MSIIAFIFARGGSKGVPGKNIRPVGGIPLVGRAVRAGQAIPRISRIILSTDNAEIAEVGRAYGAEVPFMRPADLATDKASELDAWRHAIKWVIENEGPFDIFVSLPATAPLREPSDVERCLDAFIASPDTNLVITGTEARSNPYFNMVSLDETGCAHVVLGTAGGSLVRRQDAPKLYDIASIAYVTRPEYILCCNGLFDGCVKLVEVSPRNAIDIDDEFDLDVADLLAKKYDYFS